MAPSCLCPLLRTVVVYSSSPRLTLVPFTPCRTLVSIEFVPAHTPPPPHHHHHTPAPCCNNVPVQLAQPLFDRVWWGRRDEAVTTGDVSAFLACADTPDCGIVHTTVALMQVGHACQGREGGREGGRKGGRESEGGREGGRERRGGGEYCTIGGGKGSLFVFIFF
jgi:hypothetical protein